MSVLSIIRRGRQQAKEQNKKKLEEQEKETKRPAYRHIPTHAAADALYGAPSTWRDDDRIRIMEQNKIRQSMTTSGGNITIGSTRGFPPPAEFPGTMVYYPRSYRPNSTGHKTHSWSERASEVIFLPSPDAKGTSSSSISSAKGKEVAPRDYKAEDTAALSTLKGQDANHVL